MEKRCFWCLSSVTGIVLTLVLLAPATGFAQQADLKSVVDRLERLERDIRTLNAQLARGGQGAVKLSSESGNTAPTAMNGPAAARVGLRMDRLEQDLRSTTGVLEEINHRIVLIGERLDKLVSDVDFRLSSLEARGQNGGQIGGQAMPTLQTGQAPVTQTGIAVQPIAPVATPATGGGAPATLGTVSSSAIKKIQSKAASKAPVAPVAPSVPPAQGTSLTPVQPAVQAAAPVVPAGPLPAGTPKEQYTYAFNLLRQTNYDQAAEALKAFIETNADDPLASNARYWLGETYYVRRLFPQAATTFYEAYQKNPVGPKAAESLLKLGMSLAGMGKKDDACTALAKVLSDFPKASASIKNTVARENKRNGCT